MMGERDSEGEFNTEFVNQELETETKGSADDMSESGVRDGSEDETERERDQKTKNHLDLI